MNIPGRIVAGDAVTWNDYQFYLPTGTAIAAPTYALSYSFRGPGAVLDVAATASGTTWVIALTGSQTAAFNATPAAVTWYWQAYATAAGNRYSAGNGTLYVDPNLATLSGTFDGSTQEEKDLIAIRSEISARVSGGMTIEYMIGQRSLKKESVTVLLQLESRYKSIVARQRMAAAIANGLGNPGKSYVRFS